MNLNISEVIDTSRFSTAELSLWEHYVHGRGDGHVADLANQGNPLVEKYSGNFIPVPGRLPKVRAEIVYDIVTQRRVKLSPAIHRIEFKNIHIPDKLDLETLELPLPLLLEHCAIDDIVLDQAKAPWVHIERCRVAKFSAHQLTVGNLSLKASRVESTVGMVGAKLTGNLNLTDADLLPKDKTLALRANNVFISGDLLAERLDACGEVRLSGSHIQGFFKLGGAKIESAGGAVAVQANRLTVDQDIVGVPTPLNANSLKTIRKHGRTQLQVFGGFYLGGGCVKGKLDLGGARIGGADGDVALDCSRLNCPEVLLNREFSAKGVVQLRNADIECQIDCTNGRFCGIPTAFDAQGARINGCLIWKPKEAPRGKVNLSFAALGRLDDDLCNESRQCWPKGNLVRLTGCTYRLPAGHGDSSVNSVDKRIKWLKSAYYSPSAYQQLVSSYRANGEEASAQEAAIAAQRAIRQRSTPGLKWPAWIWNALQDFSTSYGYRLYRPLIFLILMVLVGSIVFTVAERYGLMHSTSEMPGSAPAQAPSCEPGYPCFQPFVYSVQLMVPIIDFQETSKWIVDTTDRSHAGFATFTRIYTWFAIALGWILSGALLAGIGRLFRQSQGS